MPKCFDPGRQQNRRRKEVEKRQRERERERNNRNRLGIEIEPISDVLDGGVSVERPVHGGPTIVALASLEHPLFSPADQRARERTDGGECEWGAGVRNANGLKRGLFGRVAPPDTEDWRPAGAGAGAGPFSCRFVLFPWPIAFACAAAYYTLLLIVNQFFNQRPSLIN